MNSHLPERFKRSKKHGTNGGDGETAHVWILPQKLNARVAQYFEKPVVDGAGWLSNPELPTSAELMDLDEDNRSSSSGVVELAPNRPSGSWGSKEEYLSAQYELYREDAVRGIREAVTEIRKSPEAVEETFNGKIGIYEKVHICGVTPSTRGLAHRITFSTRRAGKIILWEQSKRLIAGALVVLTPADDKFQSKAIVATVAARPLEYLKLNPPEIDIFFANASKVEIDPAVEWLMIEDKAGLYEANRHTLLALQRMMREPFPLKEHILNARVQVPAPKYVVNQPHLNLEAVLGGTAEDTENINVLSDEWPNRPSSLDSSQLEALRRILTKQLAIVQGPPGTGKTHVSVQAVRIMLENREPSHPPIIVACQTNHAIDQFLRHVAKFESDFVRLGGRSKDKDIKKRTLYNIRLETSENPPAGSQYNKAQFKLKELQKKLPLLLTVLKPENKPLDHNLLSDFKIITAAQSDSLEKGASQWVQSKLPEPNEARPPFSVWLGDKLITVDPKQSNEHGFDYEEADLEHERLREEEAENAVQDEEEFDKLHGPYLPIADNFTCRKVPGIDHKKVQELLNQQDMWKIPEASRGAVYRYLQTEVKKHILPAIRDLAKKASEEAHKRRIGQFERDEPILKRQKIIGMTTTGLSKYRGLLSALQPKVVLIEEAAETLEAPVAVACMPSLQHLILVGDHKQLRPHTHVNAHEDEPFYLNVSLFERLVNNGLEFTTLRKQRRMVPEIRRLLSTIYGDLITDHPSVCNRQHRPDVPGMGGINSFFFTHVWKESRDDMMSCYNEDEARMIAGFVEYLHYNDVAAEDITILTFYNGQRKKILSELRSRPSLDGSRFTVVTVDSYQGEENRIVLLSLARSNDMNQIGFLSVDNRVSVALSRAQCGFYIFGNAMLLHSVETTYSKKKPKKLRKNKTWTKVMEIMAAKQQGDVPTVHPQRFDQHFPITCKRHNTRSVIDLPEDWEKTVGGCMVQCQDCLPCGHPCPLQCHPFEHHLINCTICRRPGLAIADSEFTTSVKDLSLGQSRPASRSTTSGSDASAWNSYAVEAENQYYKAKASYKPSNELQSSKSKLVEVDDTTKPRSLLTIETAVGEPPTDPDSASTITPSRYRETEKKSAHGLYGAADESDTSRGTPIGVGRYKWKETFCSEEGQGKKEDWSRQESLLD